MKLPFKHGLVRYQTDTSHNPVFLQKSNGGTTIDLLVNPDPTVYTISHRQTDYLFQERKPVSEAWAGPFSAGLTSYWLYFDIDIITGIRTFGHTTLEPIVSPTAPASPSQNQHWFDTSDVVMKVFQGIAWRDVLRVFAAKYENGSILQPYPAGATQVGLPIPTHAGFMLFDDSEKPIRRFDGGRRSQFITTESILLTQASGGFVNFSIESSMNVVEASQNIPKFYLISLTAPNKIGLASHLNANRVAVGIVVEDFVVGLLGRYETRGFITNEEWNFSKPVDTPVFCGPSGQVTTNVPQSGFYQRVGHIVDARTIYLDICEPIFYESA